MKLNHIYITRFIAALCVVIYHFGQDLYPFNLYVIGNIFKYGSEAVNYFFILSGFIMIIAYYDSTEKGAAINKKRYWINRFARIYPVYLLALLFVALYYITIDRNLFSSFAIRFPLEVFVLQSWLGKSSLNFPAWSLSVELLFYIMFPFLLKWFSSKTNLSLILIATILYIINQFTYITILNKIGQDVKIKTMINISPVFHIATFVIGIILGILYKRNYQLFNSNRIKTKILSYLMALSLFVTILISLDFEKYHNNGLLTPVYFFFLLAFCIESPVSKLFSTKLFVYLGDISYSIYILQYPVWLYINYIFHDIGYSRVLIFYIYLIFLKNLSLCLNRLK